MKYFIAFLCTTALLISGTGVKAQYDHRVNTYLHGGYSLPYGKMGDYYNGGFAVNMKTVTSLNDRESDFRISLVANMGYYRFAGKNYWAYDASGNYQLYRSTSFGVIPCHGGLRMDFGHTPEMPVGLYLSQDFGITYVDGPTGGSRYGHTFEIGGVIGRFDMSMAFHAWRRSIGGNFRYFTFSMGLMLF